MEIDLLLEWLNPQRLGDPPADAIHLVDIWSTGENLRVSKDLIIRLTPQLQFFLRR
jgi:hypothetical protein